MSDSFTFSITLTPEQAVEKARAAAQKEGATFEGNAKRGKFSALGVVGSYEIIENLIEVEISEKPFFAPLSIIESKIKSLFQ
jgi:hypothetical protein